MADETASFDPWAEFRQAQPAPAAPANDPWAAFRIAPQPDHESPGAIGYAKDMAEQGLRGFNKGLVSTLTLPYRALDWAGEKVTGGGFLPDVETMPLYKPYLVQPEAETTPGKYVRAAGEGVGAAAVPMVGVGAKSLEAAGPVATTTLGRIGQEAVQAFRANPGAVTATDMASAATSGMAEQAAKDSGIGPAGQAVAGIVGGIVPGAALSYRNPTGQRIGTATGESMAARRAAEGAEDAAAFAAQDVRPFGPAFNQGPVASIGKQVTETPIVGSPLRNNLDETMQDAATATRRVADQIAPNATPEAAGTSVQRGLDRFRDRSFSELEPANVAALGINPMSPVQRPQGGGQAQMTRIQQGQPLLQQITGGQVQNSRGQPVPLPQTRIQKLATRTTLEDLSDAELGAVVRAPADATSFSTRLDALYERAFRKIPPLLQSNGSRDPLLLPTANSGAVVRGIVGDEARTGISAGLQGRYGQMFETLSNPAANVTLDTLRSMRTAIGRDLSNFGMYDVSLDRTQLRRLYAALSSDIEVGLQDIAVRAAKATQAPGNRALPVDAARQAAQALRDMQVADRYARAGFDRMDRFLNVVRQPNPQLAATQLVRAATDGTGGNMRMFRAAMSVLRPEERAEFGALIVRSMGEPTAGARGIIQEVGWSPSRFVTSYQKMSPEARNLVFSPEHQKQIEQLFRVANRLANVEALANTSRSATNAINVSALGGAATSAMHGDVVTPLAIGGSMLGTAVLMSRPAYTNWMVRYMQLRAAVRDGSDRAVAPMLRHVSGLERMSMQNPALWPVYLKVAEEAQQEVGARSTRK